MQKGHPLPVWHKKTPMTKNAILLAINFVLSLICIHVNGQSYSMQRGHAGDDLYVFCRKNATSNSIMQFYHLWEHGQKIGVQYTIPYPSDENDLNLKNFVADPTPGLLYCTSLSNNDTSIYKSTDYGKTWAHRLTLFTGLTPPIALLGGSVAGEIIMTERPTVQYYSIGSTTDFFATHTTNAQSTSYFTKPEIGISSGEIYGLNNAFASNKDFLLHSFDFGATIDTIAIDSAVTYNPNGNLAQKVCHGTVAGEVFLVTLEAEQAGFPHVYRIYHSTDYGSSYAFKSEIRFEASSSYTEFSGGRESCSFYVANWKFDQQLQRQVLQVYYSADCGQTFTLYEHDLNEEVSIGEEPVNEPENLAISPNPARINATVSIGEAKPGLLYIEVFNSLGKCVIKTAPEWWPAGGFSETVNLQGLTSGIYSVRLFCNGQKLSEGKLLIAR